jgi:RimJ/RimL family protein N-acetyltransferase
VSFHGEKKPIGQLGFGGSMFVDNIFYYIYEKYQNKGLGFQTVYLLLEHLNSKGIEHVHYKYDIMSLIYW